MSSTRRDVGIRGERIAESYLRRRGYTVLHKNYRCREGEIDIIVRDEDCIVFVEVRTKRDCGFGCPEESITSVKKERLIALAELYIQDADMPHVSWRIDVIAIELNSHNTVARLNHVVNAVD